MWEFSHQTSSPRYPSSNGKVENAIKTAKMLMMKAVEDKQDPFLALLDWRNTPSETLKLSPVQIMFGCRTRTLMPTSNGLLETPSSQQTQAALSRSKDQQAFYLYNRHAKSRPSLAVGQTVRCKVSDDADNWQKGEIADTLPFRSYIRLQDGTMRRRTSKHVRFTSEPPILPNNFDTTPISSYTQYSGRRQ